MSGGLVVRGNLDTDNPRERRAIYELRKEVWNRLFPHSIQKESILLKPCKKINFRCLSHQPVVRFHGSESKLMHP